MKTKLYLIVLTVFAIAILSSCYKEELDTMEVATDETAEFTLKAKGEKGKPNNESVDSFEIVVSPFFNGGNADNPYKAIRSGGITTLDGADFDLIWNSLATEVCFDGDFSPEQRIMLNIRKEKRDGSAFVGYWFKGVGTDGVTEIDYIIRMRGVFLDDWPPQSETLETIKLFTYELDTTSGKNRRLACTTDGIAVEFDDDDDVWVAVRRVFVSQ